LDDDGQDEVIGMICVNKEDNENIMVVSQQGYGKRTLLDDENGEAVYRVTNRGGKGVKTINVTEKTGKLVAIKNVTDESDLMIINKSGITIRLKCADFRVMGRATQGVRMINLEKRNDEIAAVCKVMSEVIEDEVIDELLEEISLEGSTEDSTQIDDTISDDTESEIEEDIEE
jgi:DNA gyrase subunit A